MQSKEKEDRYVANYRVRAPFGRLSAVVGVGAGAEVTVGLSSSAQYLEEEYRKGIREDDPMPPVQPYHYGSHYSNSGTVLHFLVRMPPFTKMFLAYQGERREAGARLPFSQRGRSLESKLQPRWNETLVGIICLMKRRSLIAERSVHDKNQKLFLRVQ